jgi:hypothetical protein
VKDLHVKVGNNVKVTRGADTRVRWSALWHAYFPHHCKASTKKDINLEDQACVKAEKGDSKIYQVCCWGNRCSILLYDSTPVLQLLVCACICESVFSDFSQASILSLLQILMHGIVLFQGDWCQQIWDSFGPKSRVNQWYIDLGFSSSLVPIDRGSFDQH